MTISSNVETPLPPQTTIVADEAALFHDAFDRRSFAFTHHLTKNPLFKIERLVRTAQAIMDKSEGGKFAIFDAESCDVGTRFGTLAARDQLPETVRRLAEGHIWLKISSANDADPEYADVLHHIIRDLADHTGRDLPSEITWSSLTIFVASPGVVTPYHIDHESNFLLQVAGEKDVCLFDQDDREILSDLEIEQFYAGNVEAARYKPNLQEHGKVYHLTPGVGVHHPPLAPHSVRNGNDVSVSVSIGFCTRTLDRRAKIYQFNSLMRRAGLRPARPGQHHLRDRVKAAGIAMATRSNAISREDILFSGYKRVTAALKRVKNSEAVVNDVP